jgi:hypothetical protein
LDKTLLVDDQSSEVLKAEIWNTGALLFEVCFNVDVLCFDMVDQLAHISCDSDQELDTLIWFSVLGRLSLSIIDFGSQVNQV